MKRHRDRTIQDEGAGIARKKFGVSVRIGDDRRGEEKWKVAYLTYAHSIGARPHVPRFTREIGLFTVCRSRDHSCWVRLWWTKGESNGRLTIFVVGRLQGGNRIQPQRASAAEGVHQDDSTLDGDSACHHSQYVNGKTCFPWRGRKD